jgi:hypothetical protein
LPVLFEHELLNYTGTKTASNNGTFVCCIGKRQKRNIAVCNSEVQGYLVLTKFTLLCHGNISILNISTSRKGITAFIFGNKRIDFYRISLQLD